MCHSNPCRPRSSPAPLSSPFVLEFEEQNSWSWLAPLWSPGKQHRASLTFRPRKRTVSPRRDSETFICTLPSVTALNLKNFTNRRHLSVPTSIFFLPSDQPNSLAFDVASVKSNLQVLRFCRTTSCQLPDFCASWNSSVSSLCPTRQCTLRVLSTTRLLVASSCPATCSFAASSSSHDLPEHA